ncbi:MAG: LPXTG cell wall anchor domain-containing protein [Ruminococcaceae bacterium]|nr:LPXTG cell wall anchor domain-containing protein [Oscillospiraceae bacterium]
MKKAIISLIMIVSLFLCCFNTLYAAPDRDRNITLNVTVKSGDTKVGTGTVMLYHIAVLDGENYCYTDDFENYDKDIESVNRESITDIVDYISQNEFEGIRKVIDDNGNASFSSLKAGVYLLTQEKVAVGYSEFKPSLLYLPIINDNGEYDYDVEVTAKTEPIGKDTNDTSKSETTEPGPTLPQTGQLKWPIPILIVCGLSLIIIGLVVAKSKKK